MYFLLSLFFFPVSHCFRGWIKRNLKVYDVINCLNENLITHFVWYLEKEIRCDIETLSIDGVLNMENFYGNHAKNVHQKLARDPFLILVSNPKQLLHAINSFLNKIFWKRSIRKPLKNNFIFFRTQSVLIDKVIKSKRGLELVSSSSSCYKTRSNIFLYSLHIFWPSLMMYCKAIFQLFQN